MFIYNVKTSISAILLIVKTSTESIVTSTAALGPYSIEGARMHLKGLRDVQIIFTDLQRNFFFFCLADPRNTVLSQATCMEFWKFTESYPVLWP